MDNSSQNPSDSIIIGNCLSCQGLVRVPAKAPSSSKVRCPHCSETYALWQILDQSVPELELVVEIDEERIPQVDQVLAKSKGCSEEPETFVVPKQLSKGARRSRRRRSGSSSSESASNGSNNRSSADSPGFDGVGSRPVRSASSSSSSGRSSSRRPRSSNSKNGFAEVVKVVIGGLLAIPIAYLLVFWLFKQDPLNLGPKIGTVVPFLVPAELLGPENDDEQNLSILGDESDESDESDDSEVLSEEADADDSLPPDVDPDRADKNNP